MQKKNQKISVIGVRAYPSEFKGTSGVEVYVDKVLDQVTFKNTQYLLYTKSKYQRLVKKSSKHTVRKVFSLNSKTMESVSYCFLATVLSCIDGSSVIWFQGSGMAMFSFLPKLLGKKIVITVHGFDWERKKWNHIEKRFFYKITQFVLSHANTVTAVSTTMQNRLKDEFKVHAIITTPGVEYKSPTISQKTLKNFNLKPKNFILYVGRIVPEKRIEWLIKVFLSYKKSSSKINNPLKLVIVGSHGNLPEYEKLLKKKFTHTEIIWTGFIENKARDALLSSCKLYVLPSQVEGGNPLSFLEALSYGNNCIVPDKSVTSNFKSFSTVHYFNVDSYTSFKAAFNKIMLKKIPSLIPEEQRKSVTYLKKLYSWEKTYSIFESAFNNTKA